MGNKKHLIPSLAISALMLLGVGASFFISSQAKTNEVEAVNEETTKAGVTRGLSGDPILTDTVAQAYYSGISSTSTGTALMNELYSLIHPNKCSTGYSSIWNYLPYCDAFKPDDSSDSQVTAFYRGTGGSQSAMNKEHVWPKSRGGHAIDGDPHMVRPTFNSDNSSRGNDFYNASPTSYDPNEFGAAQYRGICARIIFYCAVQEKSNLTLVDKTTDSTVSTTTGTMGKLSTLLQWNLDYPVDSTEILRNQVLSGQRSVRGKSWNFNRNPFIDDRSYACRIWGDTNSTTKEICKASTAVAPTSISLNKSSTSIQQEGTVQLSVSSVSPTGASTDVTWSSSNTSVATVSSSGLVTAKAVGTATITATSALASSVKATCTVTVTEPTPVALTGISVTASSTSIYTGKTATISVTTTPSYVYPKPTYTYTSSSTGVATVNSSGTVTGVSAGESTITVTATQGSVIKTGTVKITVSDAPATTDYTIGWGDASGTEGTYTNFSETSGSVTNLLSFTSAKNSAGSSPAYNNSSNELRLYYASTGNGGSITITPATGITFTKAIMTTSTSPSVKYSVDGGTATSVSASSNTYTISGITATSSLMIQNVNTSNTQLRIKTITLTCTGASSIPDPTLELNKSSASVPVGSAVAITATAQNGSGDVTWESSNPSVATVSSETGLNINVTGVSAGTATITASYSGITAECTITVTGGVTPTPSSSGMKEAYQAAAALASGGTTSDAYTFTGIVTGMVGNSFYMQDGNYGMYIYNHAVASIAKGKEITVVSTLQNYSGILETKTITSATLTNETGYIDPINITSYDHLQTCNQSILADLSSAKVVSKDSAGVSGKSGTDWKITVNMGGENITVFGSKYLSNLSDFNTIYNSLSVGNYISIENMVTSYYNGSIQLALTEQSTISIGYTLEAFCDEFLNNMYCASSGTTAPTFATGFSWSEFGTLYNALSDSDRTTLTNATANEYSEDIEEQVVARYDYVVGKYHYTNFMSRTISYSSNLTVLNTDNNTLVIVIIASVVTISSIGVFFVLRKKKQDQ